MFKILKYKTKCLIISLQFLFSKEIRTLWMGVHSFRRPVLTAYMVDVYYTDPACSHHYRVHQ